MKSCNLLDAKVLESFSFLFLLQNRLNKCIFESSLQIVNTFVDKLFCCFKNQTKILYKPTHKYFHAPLCIENDTLLIYMMLKYHQKLHNWLLITCSRMDSLVSHKSEMILICLPPMHLLYWVKVTGLTYWKKEKLMLMDSFQVKIKMW